MFRCFIAFLLLLPLMSAAKAACPGPLAAAAPTQTCAKMGLEQVVPTVLLTSAQSSLDITAIPGTYTYLEISCSLLSTVASSNPLLVFYGTGATPTYLAGGSGNYEWGNWVRWTGDSPANTAFDQATTSQSASDSTEAQIISGNISNSTPVGLRMSITNYATFTDQNTATFTGSYWNGVFVSGTAGGRDLVNGTVHGAVTGPITAVRFQFKSGNVAANSQCTALGQIP